MMPATIPEMEELWRKALQSLEAAKVLRELRTPPQTSSPLLLDAFDLRVMGDYGSPGIIGKEKARALLERAGEFMREVGELLKREGYTLPVTDEEG